MGMPEHIYLILITAGNLEYKPRLQVESIILGCKGINPRFLNGKVTKVQNRI
jgi:hypothetical protein